MTPQVSPRLALAFIEDALAIASFAAEQGYPEDADAMRLWAAKVRRELRQQREERRRVLA